MGQRLVCRMIFPGGDDLRKNLDGCFEFAAALAGQNIIQNAPGYQSEKSEEPKSPPGDLH